MHAVWLAMLKALACSVVMRMTPSSWRLLVQMNVVPMSGSKNMALQNLQIPVGSVNSTVLDQIFPWDSPPLPNYTCSTKQDFKSYAVQEAEMLVIEVGFWNEPCAFSVVYLGLACAFYSTLVQAKLTEVQIHMHLQIVPFAPIRIVCQPTFWHCCASACFNLICYSSALGLVICHHNI